MHEISCKICNHLLKMVKADFFAVRCRAVHVKSAANSYVPVQYVTLLIWCHWTLINSSFMAFDGGHVGVAWRALASFLFRSGHVGDSNFDHLFITSNISAMDRLVVVKFHTNIANRWLFMIQRKITAIILYS